MTSKRTASTPKNVSGAPRSPSTPEVSGDSRTASPGGWIVLVMTIRPFVPCLLALFLDCPRAALFYGAVIIIAEVYRRRR